MTCRILASLALLACPVAAAQTTTVTFDAGAEGWVGPTGPGGSTGILATGGNPTANMRTVFNNFGITFFNSSNADFLGDFTTSSSVTASVDLKVENLAFFGSQVSRPWVVEFRDYDNPLPGYGWKSVWYLFGPISLANSPNWRTVSVTFDPRATTMPAGWGGYGAETPAGEPILPPGTTFRDVMAGVDIMVFTTLQPGFFFGFTDFTVRLDNISITRESAPVPGDVNGDGAVNATDIAAMLSAWGPCPPKGGCPADLDGDGAVASPDIAVLLSNWTG
jgi:Dockerin type I domain